MPAVAASNSKKSRPSSSFSSLPEDIVLNCLSRVPRRYYPNLSLVSKTLRSLVRSPELDRLRSQLKHVCLSYHVYHGILRRWNSYWITFRPGDEKSKTTDYQLEQKYLSPADVPNQPYLGSAVSVGSEIYFIGGKIFPSTELWILDTRSGHLRKGPAGMKVGRSARYKLAVGVVEGKIYVIGGSGCKNSQVEVFDLETQRWDYFEEKVEFESEFCVSMKQKVYMVGRDGRVSTYSPREGIKNETITEVLSNVKFVCAVKNVLYACFRRSGLMWFNTNLKVWTRVVDCDGEDGKLELYSSAAQKMEEYEGKIAFFWPLPIDDTKNHLMCKLIALDRVGVNIRGRIEWSGIVATLPHNLLLKDCLVVSG